jgi:membrane protein required for colicin V production
MSAFSLTGWDLFAVAIILISSIMAFARGLMREVFSIVAFIAAGFAAVLFAPMFEQLAAGLVQVALLRILVVGGVIFIAVFILITVATSSLAKALHKSGEIGALDRAAGLVFGAGRGILVLALVVVLFHHVTGPSAPMPDWLLKARTYPVLDSAARGIEVFVPKARDYINERRKTESAAPPT